MRSSSDLSRPKKKLLPHHCHKKTFEVVKIPSFPSQMEGSLSKNCSGVTFDMCTLHKSVAHNIAANKLNHLSP